MASTRAPFASLAAFIAVASAHAGETGKPASLETVRQDLQALQATGATSATRPAAALDASVTMPALNLALPDGAAASSADKKRAEEQTNWLATGIAKMETEDRARRELASGRTDAASLKRDGSASASSGQPQDAGTAKANPFDAYMAQWLSPRDQAILNPRSERGSARDASTARDDTAANRGWDSQGLRDGQLSADSVARSGNLVTGVSPQNPYLADSALAASYNLPAKFVQDNSEPAGFAQEKANSAPVFSLPTAGDLKTAAARVKVQEALAAPVVPIAPVRATGRVIDDRKYFPQLRRF